MNAQILLLLIGLISFGSVSKAQYYSTYTKKNKCGYSYRYKLTDDEKAIIKPVFGCCDRFEEVSRGIYRAVVGEYVSPDSRCIQFALIDEAGNNLTGFIYDQIKLGSNKVILAFKGNQVVVLDAKTGKPYISEDAIASVRGIAYTADGKIDYRNSWVNDYFGKIIFQNKAGKWGLIDPSDDQTILEPEYDSIVEIKVIDKYDPFKSRVECSFLQLYKSGKKGIYFARGNVIPAIYDSIGTFGMDKKSIPWSLKERYINGRKIKFDKAECFKDYIVGKINDQGYSVFEVGGKALIPCCEQEPPIHPLAENVRIIQGKPALIDEKGEMIIPPDYADIFDWSNYHSFGCRIYSVSENKTWKVLDAEGKELFPGIYSDWDPLWEGKSYIVSKMGFYNENKTDVYLVGKDCRVNKITAEEFEKIKNRNSAAKAKESPTQSAPQTKECVDCTVCEGSGKSKEKDAVNERCYICNGSGFYGYVTDNPSTGRDHSRWYGGPGYKKAVCTTCKGSGKVYSKSVNRNCRVCNGVGCIPQ